MAVIENLNDTIVTGTSGNDTILNRISQVTINGGKGNDVIRLKSYAQELQYADGDGNDTFYGFDGTDTLHITNGTISNASVSGVDVLLKIGSGSVLLKNMAATGWNLIDANGKSVQTVVGSEIKVDGAYSNSANDAVIALEGEENVLTLKGARQNIRWYGGNGTIVGYETDDTIYYGDGYESDTKVNAVGNDLIIKRSPWDSLTIKGAAKIKANLLNLYGNDDGRVLYVPPAGTSLADKDDIDKIINTTDNVSIDAGKSGKIIDNFGSNVTVKSDGNNQISNLGSNVSIKTGAGNDSINTHKQFDDTFSGNVTIDAGDGNNVIADWLDWYGGAGVEHAVIRTGKDADVIQIRHMLETSINAGDGNNNVEILSDPYEPSRDVTLNTGAGNDTIVFKDESSSYIVVEKMIIDTGAGNDSIADNNSSELRELNIKVGAGNDTIIGNWFYTTLDGGDGADVIRGDAGIAASIVGGAGNDSVDIPSTGNVMGVYDGAYSTINGGKGDDYLVDGSHYVYQYANGDGNDTIENLYNSGWILNLTSGSISDVSYVEGEADVRIKVGSGSISVQELGEKTLALPVVVKDAKNSISAWYNGENGLVKVDNKTDATVEAGRTWLINGKSNASLTVQDGSIINFGSGATLNDSSSDGYGIENYGSNVKINSPADDPLANYGSNVTIDAMLAGGDSEYAISNYFNSNVVINTNGKVYNSGSNVTINGSKVQDDFVWNDGSNVIINGVYNSPVSELVYSLENIGSNVTINGGGKILNRGEKVLINSTLTGSQEDEVCNFGSNVTIKGSADKNSIINSAKNVTIDAGAGNDSIVNAMQDWQDMAFSSGFAAGTSIAAGDGDDTVFNVSHNVTINGGAGNDYITLKGSGNVIQYKTGDGKDTVYGYNADDTIQISGSYSTVLGTDVTDWDYETDDEVYDVIVNVGTGSLILNGASNKKINITTGSIGGGSIGSTVPSGIEYDAKKKPSTIIVKDYSGMVDANDYSEKVTMIDASSSSNDDLVLKTNDKKGTVINAGKGDSTLIGGAKDDKLYGGEGANVFAYTVDKSKDAVYDYDSTEDVVSIEGATFGKMTFVDNKDSVKITFDGDTRSQLTVNKVESDGALTFDIGGATFTYGELPTGVKFKDKNTKTAITVEETAADGVLVDAGNIASTAKTIDGSAASGAVYLIGNANANVIKAGNKGSTLYGGLGADKLYGGDGADVFMWSTLDGADVIYSLDGGKGDYVVLDGVKSLDSSTVKMSATKVEVTINKQKLTIDNPTGEVKFVDTDGKVLYTVGVTFPDGVEYNAKKTAITVGSKASSVGTIDLSDSKKYLSTVKEIDASAYEGDIELIGNDNANVLKGSKEGSTLNGGKGNDKLYGNDDGYDVFVWDASVGGNDVIYGFDGTQDRVIIEGVKEIKDSNVKVSTNKVEVKIGSQKLTLDNPNGEINFVNANGDTLYTTGVNFPEGVCYNAKKTAIIIGSDASGVEKIDLSDPKYFSTVKEVDASAYKGRIEIIGNANANILRAGAGGGMLNGGYDTAKKKSTADKLYGSSATNVTDVFVWDLVYGGNDQIYNFAASDLISITGDGEFDKSDFKISGKNVVLSAGTGKLTINEAAGKVIVVMHNGRIIIYGHLPSGVAYDSKSKNKLMTIGGAFSGTFDVTNQDYYGTVATLDASTSTNEIELIGNKKTKAMLGGAGKTTLIGSTANDNFYAGKGSDTFVYASGDGRDVIHNFDSSTDVIMLSDTTVAVTDFTEKGNDITLTVGKGSITLKDAPRGVITVEQGDETLTYKTLPTGLTYKYTASKKSGVITVGKDFSDTLLAVSDLGGLPVTEINASGATKAIELRAGSTATKITAAKGGSKMTGGDGNDTLIGGNGNDVFVSSGGSDLIDKYTAGKDKISIVGTLSGGKANGSNVELTTSDGGTITIKGVVNKELTIINGGVDQTYKFAKTTKSLAEALIGSSAASSEIAVEAKDYWFMQSTDALDELSDITAPIAPCVLDEPKVFASPSLDVSRLITFNRKK